MKKVLCILSSTLCLLLLSSAVHACAQTTEYVARYVNQRWLCESFASVPTPEAQAAFSSRLLPDDQIICGAQFAVCPREEPRQVLSRSILMAVRREGSLLLFAAKQKQGEWTSAIESDCFLPADGVFRLEPVASLDDEGNVHAVSLSVVRGAETFRLTVLDDAGIQLSSYSRQLDDGSTFLIDPHAADAAGSVACSLLTDGLSADIQSFVCAFPIRVAAWTMDGFPSSPEALHAYAQAHQPLLPENTGYISDVNLRAQPTGQSASLGQYTARVQILGSVPGEKYPWYEVQLGDTTGWVSGRYLFTDLSARLCELSCTLLPVARADTELTLLASADGQVVTSIPAGTLLHVLAERDGWLHVILPQNAITWSTDWDGVYGFVPANSVTLGTSITDARLK